MIQEFNEDDHGFRRWKFAHPRGFVVSAGKPPSHKNTSIHHASCSSISGKPPGGGTWTGSSTKVCADTIDELEKWGNDAIGDPPPECSVCTPYRQNTARPDERRRPS